MKGKSADFMLNLLEWYCDGCIVTNLGNGIKTDYLKESVPAYPNPIMNLLQHHSLM